MEALLNAEDTQFETLQNEVTEVKNNQYVATASEAGIILFETMLGIKADTSTETLEFRRARVINRLSMCVPFTFKFLEEKLNGIIGTGLYTMTIDYNAFTLTVESSAGNQQWYHEIAVTLNMVKPANIVFINKPLVPEVLHVSEQIEGSAATYNYKLGTSWVLGAKAFLSMEESGVIKMAGISSVQAQLLSDVAAFTVNDIDNVIINDTYVVNAFNTKTSSAGLVTLEYTVEHAESSIDFITNIKIRKADNSVLTSASVYVPLVDAVVLKHTITVKEGV